MIYLATILSNSPLDFNLAIDSTHYINLKTNNDAITISIVCIICEVILMVICKPLCFIAYARVFVGDSLETVFHVSYYLLVLLFFNPYIN